jgi:ankyrin repeat protein
MNRNESIWKITSVIGILLIALLLFYKYGYLLLKMANIEDNNFCSQNTNVKSINYYLEHGGDANKEIQILGAETGGIHSNYLPLLHCAIVYHQPEIVRSLLDYKADPNIYSFDLFDTTDFYSNKKVTKLTPLHQAVLYSDNETIKLLLERGAKPNLPDHEGNTPLHNFAKKGSYSNQIGCLSETDESIDLLDLFIRYKADYYLANNDGDIALHIVARQEDFSLYKRMVALGWNSLQKNKKGETAQQLIKSTKTSMLRCEK